MTLRIAWFATAKGNSSRLLLSAALDAIASGELDAEIVCVVCNRERGRFPNTDVFFDLVEAANIPLIARSSGDWRKRVGGAISDPAGELASWRRDFDQHLFERLALHKPDIGLMAGYMLVVTDVICEHLPCLNLHPALPDGPVGTWQDVIHQLIAQRAIESGMMLQRVTTQLDRGPIVTWARYPIRGLHFDQLWAQHGDNDKGESPLFHAIREAGASREPTFILQSIQSIATDQVTIPDLNDAAIGADITPLVEAPA